MMRAVSLPGRAGQGGGDRGGHAAAGAGGGQDDVGQAAEECLPARAVLGGGDVEAGDLPIAVSVDAGGDQPVHQHGAAALADSQG